MSSVGIGLLSSPDPKVLSTGIHGYYNSPFEDIAYKVDRGVVKDLTNKGYNSHKQILNGSLWK